MSALNQCEPIRVLVSTNLVNLRLLVTPSKWLEIHKLFLLVTKATADDPPG